MNSPLTVRALVILVLDAGPAHGAEIRDRIRERTAGLVLAGEGAVHSAIASLGRDGLIEEDRVEHHPGGGRPRRFWRWTESGRAADLGIRQILVDLCAVSIDPEPGSDPGPDQADQNLDKPPDTADMASRPD